MHHLRSPGPISRWGVLLGVLLVVGPLVQSVTPCRGATGAPADAPSDVAVTAPAPGAQWTCSEAVAATTVRAVSSERPESSFDGPSVGASIGPASPVDSFPSAEAQRPASLLSISPILDALRAVVLQV
ncbi:MAG: hypothetical protein R6T83_03700 [Salinibacter sp.]